MKTYDRKNLIYVSGPYQGKTWSAIEDNIQKAEHASVQLLKLGWAVITPHKNTSHYEKYTPYLPHTYEFYLSRDFEIIRRCDAIFVLKDSFEQDFINAYKSIGEVAYKNKCFLLSEGTRQEILFCEENDILIFYELDGFPSPDVRVRTHDIIQEENEPLKKLLKSCNCIPQDYSG